MHSPRLPLFLALATLLVAGTAFAQADDAVLAERVRNVLAETPLIDGHNDLPWALRMRFADGGDVDLAADTAQLPGKDKEPRGLMTDIPRLRAGGLGGQFWSVWIPPSIDGPAAVQTTLEQIDIVHNMVARYPEAFALALTADDVERIHREGRIASLIGIEGGNQINNSLPALRQMYMLGARYMTLTHWQNTAWADAATDAPAHDGLTAFGRAVVQEMNRLGMLVDLSHVAPATMRAAIRASRAPVMFSHSSARALVDHPRDVPDDVLRMVRDNGGVVMVNFYPLFVSQADADWNVEHAGEEARLKARYPGDPEQAKTALAAWEKDHPRPGATLAQVADHVEHIRDVAGVQSVGIGSDYDGIELAPRGLESVADYPALLVELARRGWSDEDLAAVAGRNILRVMRGAEAVAREMTDEPPSRATLDMDK